MQHIYMVSAFSSDIGRICRFYKDLFSLPEGDSSEIFASVVIDNVVLGFHALAAYGLLDIPHLKDPTGLRQLVTFQAATNAELDQKVEQALKLGAKVVKGQYVTYYNQYQVVLLDPDQNVFRITVLP